MLKKNNKRIATASGFTLIEILIVLAIISILSGAVLSSISGQKEKAQASKVLAEISSRLQPMMMCWSDGGTVVIPLLAGGGNVCSVIPSFANYGTWPVLPSGFTRGLSSTGSSANWYIRISGIGSDICCNSATAQCGIIASGGACNATTPSYF